jgi:hypothetical protein
VTSLVYSTAIVIKEVKWQSLVLYLSGLSSLIKLADIHIISEQIADRHDQ